MAGSLNRVFLMGNLTRDVELRHLPSGQVVGNIGLAVNRRYRTQDGQTHEETTFIDCDAWGKTAEIMSQYLSKGRPVFIEGRLRLDAWQDKEGNNRSKLKVVVESFQFVDSRPGGSADAPEGSYSGGSAKPAGARGGYTSGGGNAGGRPAPAADNPPYEQIQDDDIPF